MRNPFPVFERVWPAGIPMGLVRRYATTVAGYAPYISRTTFEQTSVRL